jgi:hypothetical protein
VDTRLYMVGWLLLWGSALGMWEGSAEEGPQAWIRVPEMLEKEKVLWEGPLRQDDPSYIVYASDQINEKELRDYQKARGLPVTGQVDEPTQRALEATWKKVASAPPIVSIGRPQVWPLLMVLSPEKMSPPIQARVKEADFYLVQLFCSFRPVPGESRIEWARFEMHLLKDLIGHQPITLDLIPAQVTQEVKRHTKFTLAPTLKFQEVDVQGGSIEWGVEYRELEPVIIAAGGGEAIATWTYRTATGVSGVDGGKGMFLIVEAPKGMTTAYAKLRLSAKIRADGIRSWFDWIPSRPPGQEDLNVRLW